jgi:hypothetical protein
MSDYGRTTLKRIETVDDFWGLYDELTEDNSEIVDDRSTILAALMSGHLYGLTVEETDSMYERSARSDPIFVANSCYLLPCLCVVNNKRDRILILWTHSRARGYGYARKMVDYICDDVIQD